MTLVNGWSKPTTALVATASTFVLGTGSDNFVLTTGTLGDSPYYSRDGGVTWNVATVADSAWVTAAPICSIAVSHTDNRIYLANQTLSKLYVSTDNGATYSIASTGLAFVKLVCIGSTLYGNLSSGTTLYKSVDHGATFTTIALSDTTATGISCYSKDSALFVCARHADTNLAYMYRSMDAGSTWTQVLTDRMLGYVGAVFHTQTDLYLGIYDTSSGILLLKSSDNLSTSTALTTSLLPAPTTAGGSDSSNDIYFGSQYIPGVVCTSNDAGATLTNEAPDSGSATVTLATSDTSIVVVTTGASVVSVYRSALPGGKVTPHIPEISPSTTLNASPLTVTIADATAGASIYYTTDGSTPTDSSTLYTAPFSLEYATATVCTVKAIAILNAVSSSVATQEYHIGTQVSAPVITNVATDLAYTTITITDATPDVSIYYTLDGTTPTASSTLYTAAFINFESSITVKAIAIKSGCFDSDTASETFSSLISASSYPTLGPYLSSDGLNSVASATRYFTVGTTVHVEMVSSTDFAFDYAPIYYTLDGTTPTSSSSKYTTPLEITTSCVIKAVAIKGTTNPVTGSVATITYTFTAASLAKPAVYTLGAEHIDIATGAVTSGSVAYNSIASAFIPDYNNGVGALAVSVYGGNERSPGYIYLCDPITCEPFKRLAAVTASDASGGSYALAYAEDKRTLYAATDALTIYSIDVTTGTTTLLNGTLPSTIYKYLVYNNVDQCLYGCCSTYNAAAFIKYDTTTNTLSTILSNITYYIDFCDPTTGTLYGHSGTVTGLFTINAATGAATKVLTTATSYSRVLLDVVSHAVYAIVYSGTAVTAYTLDLTAGTETQKFSAALVHTTNNVIIACATTTVPAPVLSVVSGTYRVAQSVSITCANSSASIYYTVDGSTPSGTSTKYSSAVTIAASTTLKAVAISGSTVSAVTTADYVISTVVPTPSIVPNGGTFVNSTDVRITCSRTDAVIHYTVDGSTPSVSSTMYTAAFTLTVNATVKAIAVAEGSTDSSIASAVFMIAAAAPEASLPAGSYAPGVQVTLASSTSGAAIYYTLDGTVPTTSSTLYSGVITIQTTKTLRAVAYADGRSASTVVSIIYKIVHDVLFCAAWSGSTVQASGWKYGTQPGYLYRVDTKTAIKTQLPESVAHRWTSLTFSTKHKSLYGSVSYNGVNNTGDSGLIYKLDIVTGAETTITSTPKYWYGIVYDDTTDSLYGCTLEGAEYNAGYIYKVDVNTGVITRICNTAAPWRCITVDSTNGILYAAISYAENTDAPITCTGVYSIVIATGVATCINDLNRWYEHIVFNSDDSMLYLTDIELRRMAVNGYGTTSIPYIGTMSSIDFSANTKTLIASDIRVVSGVLVNVITYIDVPNKRYMDVTAMPADSGEWFKSCVSVGLVETPEPDVAPGIYTTPQQVQLLCETSDAVIHYTLDGSEPTINSPVYTGPITVG